MLHPEAPHRMGGLDPSLIVRSSSCPGLLGKFTADDS